MKRFNKLNVIFLVFFVIFASCNKTEFKNIKDVKLKVNFNATSVNKALFELTKQTPENYIISIKKVILLGDDDTNNFEIFNEDNLSSSLTFDFTDVNTTHSLMQGTNIPDGSYSSIELEIYYLQMKVDISANSTIEKRNLRIYLSDDAETENGLHQAGDITQINTTNMEEGWLLGNGIHPDMSPVSPRVAAYSFDDNGDGLGDGITWLNFGGKPGNNYGPFGNLEFMNNTPHPIYSTTLIFEIIDNKGTEIILDFNINECWQFEDKDGSGAFGAADLNFDNEDTQWHMALPIMTVTLE